MPSYNSENYDRALWQSARTKNGKVAELPLAYMEAWAAAHAEETRRNEQRPVAQVLPFQQRRRAG